MTVSGDLPSPSSRSASTSGSEMSSEAPDMDSTGRSVGRERADGREREDREGKGKDEEYKGQKASLSLKVQLNMHSTPVGPTFNVGLSFGKEVVTHLLMGVWKLGEETGVRFNR
ncbi:hypothetical protein O181_041136 [Austropuccinia psidii MF-1]|uniref:Uncharacterized protein n=1 Tax=Austropuccinia psidii MF-1 TaxID=1389203 RepID=A0A9Q3DCK4_9BASI|nr:hypothetical protein [Austropuccinia psidii MF-1]